MVIALITFIGYKRGLIKVAFKLISFLLAIVLAVVLYKPISNFIINNTLYEIKKESKFIIIGFTTNEVILKKKVLIGNW